MGFPICPVRVAPSIRTSLLLLVLPFTGAHGAAAPLPSESGPGKLNRLASTPDTEVRCTDGSVLKVKILDESLPLKTPYGRLVIPFSKVGEINCATRLPDALVRRIAVAISELGSSEPKRREAASAELDRLRAKAYPALLRVEESKDAEVRRRARRLLEKIRGAVSEEELVVRPRDVVLTEDSKISGQIEVPSLRVHTEQFGELRLKLSDVRSLRLLTIEREEKIDPSSILPDPGHLYNYQAQVGKTFYFRVTGAVAGNVWGTDVYTLDSSLATVAVHTGALPIGKTGVVKVKILPPRAGFIGSPRNGVTSGNYGMYPGAYEIIKKGG